MSIVILQAYFVGFGVFNRVENKHAGRRKIDVSGIAKHLFVGGFYAVIRLRDAVAVLIFYIYIYPVRGACAYVKIGFCNNAGNFIGFFKRALVQGGALGHAPVEIVPNGSFDLVESDVVVVAVPSAYKVSKLRRFGCRRREGKKPKRQNADNQRQTK